MLVGYMRDSKADGSQTTDLQCDALLTSGIDADSLYEGRASGKKDDRLHLAACLKSLRHGDTLMVCRDGSDERFTEGLDERMAHLRAVATDVQFRYPQPILTANEQIG